MDTIPITASQATGVPSELPSPDHPGNTNSAGTTTIEPLDAGLDSPAVRTKLRLYAILSALYVNILTTSGLTYFISF